MIHAMAETRGEFPPDPHDLNRVIPAEGSIK